MKDINEQYIPFNTVTNYKIITKTNKVKTDLKASNHRSDSGKTYGGRGRKF